MFKTNTRRQLNQAKKKKIEKKIHFIKNNEQFKRLF